MIAILLFSLSVAFVLYVFFGYPLLLDRLARKRARPIARGPMHPPISILIAVHNGEAFLENKLKSVLAVRYPRELMEIIVISDGSTDGTEEIARRMEPAGIQLIAIPRGGKAVALNAGIAAASNPFLVFTDVRQELDPDCLDRMLACFSDPAVGVVSGALVIRDPRTHEEANTGLYWKYEFWIRDRLSQLDSIFGASGALYAMRRELAVPIPPGILLDDMYLPLAAFFRGYRLVVEPKAYCYDYPTALDTEFRRKVRTLAGNYQVLKAYPGLLGSANRLWFHFMSYKFARLFLPFALIAILVTSCLLPAPFSVITVTLQVLFYGLAASDGWISNGSPLKRVTSPVRTLVALMCAGLYALLVFVVPSETLWKPTKVAPRV